MAVIEGLAALKRALGRRSRSPTVCTLPREKRMDAGLESQRLARREKNRWAPVKNVELWQASTHSSRNTT